MIMEDVNKKKLRLPQCQFREAFCRFCERRLVNWCCKFHWTGFGQQTFPWGNGQHRKVEDREHTHRSAHKDERNGGKYYKAGVHCNRIQSSNPSTCGSRRANHHAAFAADRRPLTMGQWSKHATVITSWKIRITERCRTGRSKVPWWFSWWKSASQGR